jgi:ribosomal protein S18 acetylase RimI-like enzyme
MEIIFNKLKDNDSYIFLCAIENNTLWGTVTGIICEELYGNCNPFLLIENLIVDVDYKRKGIGKKLFTEMEKLAKERNCSQIIVYVVTVHTRHVCFAASRRIGLRRTAGSLQPERYTTLGLK